MLKRIKTRPTIILHAEIELEEPGWKADELEEMTDGTILDVWNEDWQDDVIRAARMRVQRGDSQGYEYLFDLDGTIRRVEWSKPKP